MNRGGRMRLALFVLVALGCIILAGTEYVGIPQRYLGQSYSISVNLAESGGIFPNAEVTERGVQVGRVKALHLTPDGVRADLMLDKHVRIPVRTLVKIANLSAVGEQYVDLLPQVEGGPYLEAGAALPLSAATTPVQVTDLLMRLDRLATSIGIPQLRSLVTSLGQAFDGAGQDLQTVLDQTRSLTADLAAAQPATDGLLRHTAHVLRTQRDLESSLARFSIGLDRLSDTLVKADPDVRALLDSAPRTLDDVAAFLEHSQTDVGVLLGNLLSTTQIAAAPARLEGQNDLLVIVPLIMQQTFNGAAGDGYTRLGVVLSPNPKVCTKGYETSGQDPPQQIKPPSVPGEPSLRANLDAYCAEPAASGIDVRGAANAVRPPGDTTARPVPRSNPRAGGAPPGAAASPGPSRTTRPAAGRGATAGYSKVRVLGPGDLHDLLTKDLR